MKITTIILLLLLTGCASLQCRHEVLATALYAREQGRDVMINVYSIDDTRENYHAQSSYVENGKKVYLSQFAGFVFESESRTQPYYGYYADFTIEGFVSMLKKGTFDYYKDKIILQGNR